MADELTPLLEHGAQGRRRPEVKRTGLAHCACTLSVTTVSCGIALMCALLLLAFNSPLADEGHLVPFRGLRCDASIPLTLEFITPLSTAGKHILDARNRKIRLKSINWYGASDINFVPSGLDIRHRDEISRLIRCMGFNNVRLPYSDEMVRSNPLIPAEQVLANSDLIGSRALDVFAAVTQSLTNAGVSVVVNNHITKSTWCCGINPCDLGWANDWLGHLCRVRQTKTEWIENWETIMRPFANDSLVIGADLRNEVRGLWGAMHWETWAAVAETVAEALLEINREWLMIVEGISSANDLSGVRKRPVQLSVPGRVLYSAHVYSWSGWGQFAPYSSTSYNDFAKAMREKWAYLVEENLAPVWVGEMGTAVRPTDGDLNYWRHLMRLLAELDADWGYWAINPRKPAGNETEGYRLVEDDWETVRWDYRMEDLSKLGLHGQLKNATEQI